jgi:plastocyanin
VTRTTSIIAAILLLSSPSLAADVTGTVTSAGRPASETIVYLERSADPLPSSPAATVVMDQRNLRFLPKVLPVQRGTVIDFRNSDDVQHNVFTPSEAGGQFDLGTYNRGEQRSVKLDRIGELVILCNIHMEMEAHVVVVRDPFFTVTDEQGAYRIANVPAGTYTLRVWQRRWLDVQRSVDVPAVGDVIFNVAADGRVK